MGTIQEDANAIGANMRELEEAIADGAPHDHLAGIAAELHEKLSRGLVNHLPVVNWYEAAGVSAPLAARDGDGGGDGGTQNAGTKQKPQPE